MRSIIITVLVATLFIGCKKNPEVDNKKLIITTKNSFVKPLAPLPCQEFEVIGKDSLKRKVMDETINFFLRTNCFINNRGIVNLYLSFNEKGNEVWSMYSTIDNVHIWRGIVTPFYEDFDGDMVIIYKEDYNTFNKELSESEKKKIQECNDHIIGNRVYERPTREDRWTNEYLGSNNPNPQGQNRGYTGTTCQRRVIFDGRGGYKVIERFY